MDRKVNLINFRVDSLEMDFRAAASPCSDHKEHYALPDTINGMKMLLLIFTATCTYHH